MKIRFATKASLRVLVAHTMLVACGCVGTTTAPTIWPPANFRLVVEEVRFDSSPGAAPSGVVRMRFTLDATGTAVYATSSESLLDVSSGTPLPVFDRLASYRLPPECTRALARRIERLGIAEVQPEMPIGEQGKGAGVRLEWQAFEERRTLPASGRVRGAMADILALCAAHFPRGETFQTPLDRPVVPVLQGVPVPRSDLQGALQFFTEGLASHADDEAWLLAGFALACRTGDREVAQRWLIGWQRVAGPSTVDPATGESGQITSTVLTRLLPRAGAAPGG